MGARIVAVSDIFSALREDRPYRSSLGWNAIEQILLKLVEGGGLDSSVVEALLANKEVIDFSWEKRRETMNNPVSYTHLNCYQKCWIRISSPKSYC